YLRAGVREGPAGCCYHLLGGRRDCAEGADQGARHADQEPEPKRQVSGAAGNTGGVEVVAPAQAPTSPSSPKPVQDGLLGLAAGLVLGLAFAFLRDSLDDALTSK